MVPYPSLAKKKNIEILEIRKEGEIGRLVEGVGRVVLVLVFMFGAPKCTFCLPLVRG